MRPAKVRICGKTYAVVWKKRMKAHGYTDDPKQIIEVELGCHPEQERDTVLHEVIHAIDYAVHGDLKERQVHALACGLLQVLRENPDFVSYLTSDS